MASSKGGHTHDMKPDRLIKPTVFSCTSCAFRCTPAAAVIVNRRPGSHKLVRAKDPQARMIWDGR